MYCVLVVCASEHHRALLLWIGAPALFLYVLGVPAAAFFLLFKNREKLDSPRTRERLGFLYSNYEPEYFYWELMVVMRLVAFAGISVMFAGDAHLQAGLGLLVLFVSTFTQKEALPYLEMTLNRVEEGGLIASWITLYGGTLLYSSGFSDSFKVFISFGIILVNLGYAGFILYIAAKQSHNVDVSGLTSLPTRMASSLPFRVDSFPSFSGDSGKSKGLSKLGVVEMRDRKRGGTKSPERVERSALVVSPLAGRNIVVGRGTKKSTK